MKPIQSARHQVAVSVSLLSVPGHLLFGELKKAGCIIVENVALLTLAEKGGDQERSTALKTLPDTTGVGNAEKPVERWPIGVHDDADTDVDPPSAYITASRSSSIG